MTSVKPGSGDSSFPSVLGRRRDRPGCGARSAEHSRAAHAPDFWRRLGQRQWRSTPTFTPAPPPPARPETRTGHSWRWTYPQWHHRPHGPERLRGSQPACASQDRTMDEHRTWRAANRPGRRRLRHSARGGPRSRLDQYRPTSVAFGCLGA